MHLHGIQLMTSLKWWLRRKKSKMINVTHTKKATARSLSVHLTDFFFLFSPLFSTCRYVEQRSSDAPRSSRPECHSYGSKCRWDDSLHAGSKLHHRHHLSRISVCSLCCHGMLCLCMKSVFSLLKITD